ncbi:MAG: S9 family peptidase, partial [Rudaea sp.]
MHAFALCAALLVNAAAVSAVEPANAPPVDARIFAPLDVFKLEWADHPQLSPDGRFVVYERKRFDIMKDRKRSSLW